MSNTDTLTKRTLGTLPAKTAGTFLYSGQSFDDLPWKSLTRVAILSQAAVIMVSLAGPLSPPETTVASKRTPELTAVIEQTDAKSTLLNTSGATADRKAEISGEIIERKQSARLWGTRDGEPPPQAAFDDALAFIDILPSEALNALTRVFSSGDGEVGFVWKTPTAFLEVAFAGDHKIQWAAQIGSESTGGEPAFTPARSLTRLPEKLEKALDQFIGSCA